MRDRGLDALVAGTPENVFYLSGVRLLMQRLIPNRFSFVLLTADRSTLITVHSDADHARRDAAVDAVLEYGHTAPPLGVLSQAIADAGLDRGRIGIETGFIPVSEFTVLSQSLRGGELVPPRRSSSRRGCGRTPTRSSASAMPSTGRSLL